jgi:hypothetical protein
LKPATTNPWVFVPTSLQSPQLGAGRGAVIGLASM